jgi:two-component system, chemotaxis family, response regulator PixG
MNISNQKNNVSFKDSIVEFNNLKTSGFSGNVIIQVVGTPGWMLSFSSGRLAGISGGLDALDRWNRSLALASLNVPLDRLVKSNNNEEIFLNSNRLAQEWAVKEVLFDIIQFSQNNGDRLSYQIVPHGNNLKVNSSLPLLDIQILLHEAIQSWQEWEKNGLNEFSPSLFAVIHKPEQVDIFNDNKELVYLISSIDGNRSLRSLAVHHQKKLIDLTISILPLLKTGIIKLTRLPKSVVGIDSYSDEIISPLLISQDRSRADVNHLSVGAKNTEIVPLIACIDDSIAICKSLDKIITDSGYRYIGIQDPLKIIPTLIKNKPSLIFLDLVMPITNGYEVCEQIRKTPCLANIPIIILTGKDSLIDRVRTKFIGVEGFLAKPVQAESILKIVEKHLSKSRSGVMATGRSIESTDPYSSSSPVVRHQQPETSQELPKRILIVDDDDNIREVVSMCLQKLKGWTVSAAASGQEGLESLRADKPDAIVLDLMMPNMDGLTFLRTLRADPTTHLIPVVMLTANRHLPARNVSVELGVENIISKPFVPTTLVQQIDRVLN